MSESPILVSRSGDVAIITMNRPTRMNAMSMEMVEGMITAVEEAGRSARALLITGAGRAFCSGADLQGGPALEEGADMGLSLEQAVNPLLNRIADLTIPVVTAINGAAAGAGAGLALAGDFALAGRSAYFLLAFVNVGLVPDAGLSFLLPRLVGRQRALAMMMLGEKLPAETAESWGLIHRAVADDELMDQALQLATRLAAGPTRSYGIIRRNMRISLDGDWTQTLQAERIGQRDAGHSADFREGVAAFTERRKPVFQGR